jgi:signal transduction histidine kinase
MPEKLPEDILILIGSTLIILILVIVIVVAVFIHQKRKFQHRQKINDLQNRFEQEALKTQLEIQTQTFETVSKELHDNISNTISLALLNLNLFENEMPGQNQKVLSAKQLMLEAKNAVKDFSWHINPANISTQGLHLSVKELVEKFRKLNTTEIVFSMEGEEFLIDAARQIIIYRIIQEALSNSIKHSGCSKISLRLLFENPVLGITINDNGCGFDREKLDHLIQSKKGSGVVNMISRAKMMGAKLSLESETGRGTLLELSFNNDD